VCNKEPIACQTFHVGEEGTRVEVSLYRPEQVVPGEDMPVCWETLLTFDRDGNVSEHYAHGDSSYHSLSRALETAWYVFNGTVSGQIVKSDAGPTALPLVISEYYQDRASELYEAVMSVRRNINRQLFGRNPLHGADRTEDFSEE
jgi:hypothetical protein